MRPELQFLRMLSPSPKVFFIGFNKCGTTSFHKFFKANGYLSAHSSARVWPTFRRRNIAQHWAKNVATGADPLRGMGFYRVFSGVSYANNKRVVEGNAYFRELHRAHPEAYFVLNTRPMEAWIQSRRKHHAGRLLAQHAAARGVSEAEVPELWRSEREAFEAEVAGHFAGSQRFLTFDLASDDIETLTGFLAGDFALDPGRWKHLNRTDRH